MTNAGSASTTDESVITYEVVISAPNPDLKLKPRLTANVTIYILDKQDVLSVPARALRFTPEYPLIEKTDIVVDCEGTDKVWTREGNTFTAHPVQLGISNGIMTEILGGVDEGLVIVEEAVMGSTPQAEAAGSDVERSPFMPGPPSDKKKNSK